MISFQCMFHFFSHWAHLQSQTVFSCHFSFVSPISMFFFFPLEIIPVTTHLTSDPLPSFLELLQPPFSSVSLSCHHIKVNEADLLLGENTPCGLHSSGVMTGLFLYLWHTLVLGAVSCSGFSLVILIKKIVSLWKI